MSIKCAGAAFFAGAISFAFATSAIAAPWFDAGMSEYETWPDDGSDVVLTGVGTWTGTGAAKLVSGAGGSRLNVDTDTMGSTTSSSSPSRSLAWMLSLTAKETTSWSRGPS